jgi:PAS domain S-box-containing protein
MDNAMQTTLFKMRKDFIARLPNRLKIIKTLAADLDSGRQESVQTLQREVHSLLSAAGVHGLIPVCEAASDLEHIVAAMSTNKTLDQQQLDNLHKALAKLEAQTVNLNQPFVPQITNKRITKPRVVVIGDDREQTDWLSFMLEQAGYRIDVFYELAAFKAADSTLEPPSAVIIDMWFPESGDTGPEAIKQIKGQYSDSFPVIFISVCRDMASKLAVYRAGASSYLTKPLNTNALLRVVADSVAAMPAVPFRVLLVDDDPVHLVAHSLILRQAGMIVREVGDPLKVPDVLEEFAAEILVLDMYMPECSGPELATLLRDDERYAQVPIVYLSVEGSVSEQLSALNRGGDHFLTKPVNPRDLVAAVSLHARRFRQAQEQAESLRATLYERERQQQALDAHAIVSAADASGTIIYANERFCEVSGYRADELLGQTHRIVKSGEHPPEFYREMWLTIVQGNIWQGEVCNRRKDGSLYWVETSIVPFLNNAGRPYQYFSIRTDITHIKEAELRLRLLERAVEASTSSISMVDAVQPDMPLIYVNPAFERITGYKRDEVLGRNCRLLQGAELGQPSLDKIRKALQNGCAGEALVRNYRKDGTPFWNELRIAPVHDEQGRLTHFIGISDDVTERKLAEFHTMEQQARLMIFKHIIENVADGVITIDVFGAIRSFNPAAEKLFGYSASEIINNNINLLMPEPYSSEHDQYLARYISGRPAGIAGKQLELAGKRKDGSIFPLELAVSVMEIDQTKHFVGIMRDISERKQYEQEIIAAKNEAERANNAKSEFLSSMSHELRTPMNAILGFGQLLEIETGLNEDQADYVNEMLKAGRHLLELINEVLDLSMIESGNINLSLEPLSCTELIKECFALVNPIAQGVGITINEAISDDYAVRADRTRLKQVLLNLLSNAIKYNRPQGDVEIRVSAQNGNVRLAVSDTGYGIPAERQAELFQPFSRLGAEDTPIEGTGIGLTISRRLIEMMGGSIGVTSETGRGSTFWIELPETSLALGAQNYHPDDRDNIGRDGNTGEFQHTVLYIEDNPANLRLVAQILGKNPQLQLITAHNPELGLELAMAHKPNLILLDINLPGMDGYQVLSVLRSLESAKKTPVIAISANATQRDIERGIAAGFNEYITKPIDVVRFVQTVNRLLAEPDCATML